MFEICLKFLKAECTEDWQLHVEMRCMMLQYFASLCYYNYQKSAYLHLQTMSKIHVTNRGLQKQFMNEVQVIRRRDRFNAGFFSGLVKRQVLMRSLKTSEGLTRGCGMSESQRAIWFL